MKKLSLGSTPLVLIIGTLMSAPLAAFADDTVKVILTTTNTFSSVEGHSPYLYFKDVSSAVSTNCTSPYDCTLTSHEGAGPVSFTFGLTSPDFGGALAQCEAHLTGTKEVALTNCITYKGSSLCPIIKNYPSIGEYKIDVELCGS